MPATIAPTWAAGCGTSRTMRKAASATAARNRSVTMLFAMPITACATTATAAAFSPASQPASEMSPRRATPSANATMRMTLGSVKPKNAASMPP